MCLTADQPQTGGFIASRKQAAHAQKLLQGNKGAAQITKYASAGGDLAVMNARVTGDGHPAHVGFNAPTINVALIFLVGGFFLFKYL